MDEYPPAADHRPTGIGGMAALVRGDLPDAVRRLGEAIDKGESVNNWNAVNYLPQWPTPRLWPGPRMSMPR